MRSGSGGDSVGSPVLGGPGLCARGQKAQHGGQSRDLGSCRLGVSSSSALRAVGCQPVDNALYLIFSYLPGGAPAILGSPRMARLVAHTRWTLAAVFVCFD